MAPAIHLVDVASTRVRKLVEKAYWPTWSPNGRELAVALGTRITIMSPDGVTIRSLPGAPAVAGLDWQPVCTAAGGPLGDRLVGTRGDDVLCGQGGPDRITGGAGFDRLFGEDGDDAILARDRRLDVVGCGSGQDSVVADRGDRVGVDCERVRRS